ncbi:HEAT repeat domain-containing protein [Kitasatospora sp. NPDC051170]|uniref:HEAT repeat domain-containing protein n=1 Tax=Kitasatospora sp. NPDC051170 TaxID=3364056 RepID=UPI003798087D
MLGFPRTDTDSLVAYLGDPQRTVGAYWALLQRGDDALDAIRAGLSHPDAAVREGCCRLLDHLVDTESMDLLIAMADDPDAKVRISAFHALACDRCKGDTCAPGADLVLDPALRHLATDPDPQVRLRAAELAGKFAHVDDRALAALRTSQAEDPSPAVRKKVSWYLPGGTIYERTAPRPLR